MQKKSRRSFGLIPKDDQQISNQGSIEPSGINLAIFFTKIFSFLLFLKIQIQIAIKQILDLNDIENEQWANLKVWWKNNFPISTLSSKWFSQMIIDSFRCFSSQRINQELHQLLHSFVWKKNSFVYIDWCETYKELHNQLGLFVHKKISN